MFYWRTRIRFHGKMSQKDVATVPKDEPNIWRHFGTASNENPDTNQSNAQQNQPSPPKNDVESEERLALIFKSLDRNGNGRIDIQELSSALKGSGMPHQYAEVSVVIIIE